MSDRPLRIAIIGIRGVLWRVRGPCLEVGSRHAARHHNPVGNHRPNVALHRIAMTQIQLAGRGKALEKRMKHGTDPQPIFEARRIAVRLSCHSTVTARSRASV